MRALGGAKLPFDIDDVLTAVRKAIAPYRKAALFELADAGFKSVFEQLVACMAGYSRAARPEELVP